MEFVSARRMEGLAFPAATKAFTAWISRTMVTMLLAKRSRRVMMLSARATLRPMKMSGRAVQHVRHGRDRAGDLHPFMGMLKVLKGLEFRLWVLAEMQRA